MAELTWRGGASRLVRHSPEILGNQPVTKSNTIAVFAGWLWIQAVPRTTFKIWPVNNRKNLFVSFSRIHGNAAWKTSWKKHEKILFQMVLYICTFVDMCIARTWRTSVGFELDWSRVIYLKPWPNGVASRRKWKLGSTCDSFWPGLACTCVDLGWLALTLVEIKFARKSNQVFHRLATQPELTQVEWRQINLLLPHEKEDSLP